MIANLYFPKTDQWIHEAVEKEARKNGISTTEQYMRLMDDAMAVYRPQLEEQFKARGISIRKRIDVGQN